MTSVLLDVDLGLIQQGWVQSSANINHGHILCYMVDVKNFLHFTTQRRCLTYIILLIIDCNFRIN